jgi:hypothetical protein
MVVFVARRREGHDKSRSDAEAKLHGERRTENPPATGSEMVVEAGEEEGADAEAEDRRGGPREAGCAGRVFVGGEANADVDSIT